MGYSANEILGRHYDVFFSEQDQACNAPAEEIETARVSGSGNDTRWLVPQKRERYWAEGVLTAILDGNGIVTGSLKLAEIRPSGSAFKILWSDLSHDFGKQAIPALLADHL